MGIRIDSGLPSGGLGHAGLVSTLGSLIAAVATNPAIAVLIAVVAVTFGFWSAVGLRRVSDNDGAHDRIIWTNTPDMEDDLWGWLLGKKRTRVFRLSTLMC